MSTEPRVLNAPWTDEQVIRLNAFQRKGKMHPFTCPNRSDPWHESFDGNDVGLLIADSDCWYCPYCDYTQDWAHSFMADGTWE